MSDHERAKLIAEYIRNAWPNSDQAIVARAYVELRATNDRLAETNQENAQKIEALAAELEEVRADLSKVEKQLDDWRARAQGRQSLLDDARTAHSGARAELSQWRENWQHAVDQVAVLEEQGGNDAAELARVRSELAEARAELAQAKAGLRGAQKTIARLSAVHVWM